MHEYSFVTHWQFAAPLEAVWDALYDPEDWPSWWRAVESVKVLERGDEQGIGTLRRYTWRGALPYRLTFDMRTTLVEPMTRLEGAAHGDLEGTGRWRFSSDRGVTRARYDWTVVTTKPWMRLLTPLARPLFQWNHDLVMRWGAEGLSIRLGCGEAIESSESPALSSRHGGANEKR